MADNKIIHGQMIVVDGAGDEVLLHQETSASDVLLDNSSNTQGALNTSAIPASVDNVQKLINYFGTLAFKSMIRGEDFDVGIIKNTYDVTESGKILDARVGKDLNDRLSLMENEEIIAVGTETESVDYDLPETEINDDVVSLASTWSSDKLNTIIQEILEDTHVFYVPLVENADGSYTAQKSVAEIEEAYQASYPVWVVASEIFIPLRQRVDENNWIFSGYADGQAYDILISTDGVVITYKPIASLNDALPNPNALKLTGRVNAVYDGSEEVEVEIPVVIKDEETDVDTTWSSKKIIDAIEESARQMLDNVSALYVTINANDDGSYSTETTVDAIEEAYQAEMPIYAVFNNTRILLTRRVSATSWIFSAHDNDYCMDIIVTNNGVNINTVIMATMDDKLANPNVLKITGLTNATYDGSTEVTVNIPTEINDSGSPNATTTWSSEKIVDAISNGLSDTGSTMEDTINEKITTHNTNSEAHNDIRELISGLSTRLNTIANSTDVDLDQLAEIVAYIKNNKSLIDQITTNKVNVSDIINNLTSDATNKPLSAAQGKALKALIDAVPSWAMASTKPSYTASEVGADASGSASAVQANLNTHTGASNPHGITCSTISAVPTSRTINSKKLTGNITLSASDVGADAAGAADAVQTNLNSHTGNKSNPHAVTCAQISAVPTSRTVNNKALSGNISLTYSDVGADQAGAASTVQNNLNSHTGNKSNPHGVTCSQVGADPVGSAASVEAKLNAHIANKSNPHVVTCDQISAVPTSRTVNGKALSGNISLTYGDVGADAAGAANTAESNAKTDAANTYMKKSSPRGTGNFAMNLDADKVIGSNSSMFGVSNSAGGKCSFVEGCLNNANAGYSHAAGYGNIAKGMQYVIGRFCDDHDELGSSAGSGENSGTAGIAFIIGNGTSTAASNCFEIHYTGNVYAKGNYGNLGQDYAEYFEWLDKNITDEDRRGYFVTLDGLNIKKANAGDYILGIISSMPSVVGNTDMEWVGKYLRDEYGSYIYEEKEVDEEVFDEETGETKIEKRLCKFHVLNPEYNQNKKYLRRSDRPEWDAVGMLGVLAVRDDGTCDVNGFCQVADGGIATKSETGYRVVERVNDHLIKIIFK